MAWPYIGLLYNCSVDKAIWYSVHIRRVVTCTPRLSQTTINQWPEQLETSQPTAYRLRGRAASTSVSGNIRKPVFTRAALAMRGH